MRRSWCTSFPGVPLADAVCEAAQVGGGHVMIGHEPSEQLFGRPLEERADEPPERGPLRGALLHRREVAMRLAFLLVCEKALCLEVPEDGEDGGVGEPGGEALADFADGAGAALPDDGHDIEFAFAE